MDRPISGDKYLRTLSHYLRSNQRRLLPPTRLTTSTTPTTDPASPNYDSTAQSRAPGSAAPSVASAAAANARSFVTPADPMAAAYQGMVSSLWNATTAVVSSITPASLVTGTESGLRAPERDAYTGTWDGTSTILPDANEREAQLYYQAQLRSPILPLDLYYLLYLLERFEQEGIEIEGWEGVTSRIIGDATPHVIPSSADSTEGTGGASEPKAGNGMTTSTSYSSFPPAGAGASTRPQSIRSFSSTAVSTLTLITGWKQWSTAASFNSSNLTITDDILFIRKFMKHAPSLRLVAKIPPGNHVQGRGRIEGFNADAILTLFNHGERSDAEPLLLLPLAATFPSLTHLELHKIPPDCIEGWETLMKQLRSLVIVQSGVEDVHDVIVDSVVKSERRRRRRISREMTRAGQIKEEQEEALKDAALTSQKLDGATATVPVVEDKAQEGEGSNGHAFTDETEETEEQDDDATILSSLRMWPVLRHLSLSDNSLPALAHHDTFLRTQSITSLDLSHNLFLSPPSGLIHLHNLNDLNLSYNMISGVQSIYQILGNISVLDLRGNRLESLSGLEKLWNLEKVDVRENHLDEAAEVGRLAALPGIREVWSERNPFCAIQPKYRLEILAVFKANGHELLLDGTFASFIEKRALANMSPSSFSRTIPSSNNVANIPPASAPVATFAQELSQNQHHHTNHSRSQSAAEEALNATTKISPGTGPKSPINKLVKKKLVKSPRRVKRVVNLDSEHEDEFEASADKDVEDFEGLHDEEVAAVTAKAAESPAVVKKKKKKTSKRTGDTPETACIATGDDGAHNHSHGHSPGDEKESTGGSSKPKKRVSKKKHSGGEPTTTTAATSVSFAGDHDQDTDIDHSLCHDGHHVHRHRLAHLEKSMASLQVERPALSAHQRQPSRGILKKNHSLPPNALVSAGGTLHSNAYAYSNAAGSGAISPRLRPSSPIGSFSSDDTGGADGYRRKIEAMRNEAGKNWLMVLAEMDAETPPATPLGADH